MEHRSAQILPAGTEAVGAPKHFPEKELSSEIIGTFYKVYNYFGYGFLESVYMKALYAELTRRGVPVEREVRYRLRYEDGSDCGLFKADLIADKRILVEGKATRNLSPEDQRILLNYLRCSNIEVGLLLHFGPKPRVYRLISSERHRSADASEVYL